MPPDTAFIPPKIAPAPDNQSLFGFLRAMVRNPISAAPLACYHEPLVVLSLSGATLAFIVDPELLEEMLVRRPADFPKSPVDDRILRPAFGNSLLTAEGEDWRWKRRLVAPHFAPAALERYVPDMVAPFHAAAQAWLERADARPADVAEAMTSATFDVIRTALFSGQNDSELDVLSAEIESYLEPIAWVTGLATLKMPEWVPHPGRGQLRRARDRMRSVVGRAVQRRRRAGESSGDICDDLIRAHDPETHRSLTDDDLVDVLLTLVAAGHETSAKALTWVLLCLSEQPDLQDELAAEVAQVLGSRAFAAADFRSLPKVEAFLKETMRLFPPAPLMARQTTRAERMNGHDLKAGTIAFIPIYALHRNERLWRDPNVFDHTRFLGGNGERRARTAYMPFGAGSRSCVGATFAMMEMVAGLATLLQSVRFDKAGTGSCEPIHRVTLRPEGGLQLDVSARTQRDMPDAHDR